uniref:TIR domain-containing protein n=1 Tax=Leptobrachium leishanense TaxID=445787 RepID=A0A8C5QA04_9ANUR
MDAVASVDNHLTYSVPPLGKDDKYHVFVSYSSGDSIWVYGLIRKLEDTLPDLKICYHERDFLPGKTIVDNMVDCIQSSQKTVVVMSPDFVRSRWCLFEAKLSIFRDCMVHKAIIPIMLKPCTIPIHISHMTYLEAEDDNFFEKLSQVLLTPNESMTPSTLVHYQNSVLYEGKTILTLPAVNDESESWEPGKYSTSSVPDQLRALVDDAELYKEAIEIINNIHPSRSYLYSTCCKVIFCIILFFIALGVFAMLMGSIGTFCAPTIIYHNVCLDLGYLIIMFLPFALISLIFIPAICTIVIVYKSKTTKNISQEMTLKTGEANLLLMRASVLAGCRSKSQLYFVYVSLKECKQTFDNTFGGEKVLTTTMWEKAIINYSSDYACCLAKKHFPFDGREPPGHLEGELCFCQYVAARLKN